MADDWDRQFMREDPQAVFDAGALDGLIDRRVVAMRRMVELMRSDSDAETLRALRIAFPDVPLAERIAVLKETAG